MVTAKQAKQQVIDRLGAQQRVELHHLQSMTQDALKDAINRGLMQVTVTLSPDIDPTLVNAFRRVMEKLGYKAVLEHSVGSFEDNLFVAPKSTLTLRWS
jgi:hypothetical protein